MVVSLACLVFLDVYRARRLRNVPPAFRAVGLLSLVVALAFASQAFWLRDLLPEQTFYRS